jgi:tetratricopeptide (TPR) repeat protein
MRTHLFRGVMTLAVLLLAFSAPAAAQSVVRGKVADAQGKPVPDATILFEAVDANRKTQTKTDKNGQFLQVGLQSGAYKVTASKDGVGMQTLNSNVRQGPNPELSFSIVPAAAAGAAGAAGVDKEAAAALQAAAGAALDAMKAGRHDEAITKFNEVVVKVPTCADCYFNLGQSYLAKQDYAQAETAFKKVIELKPDSADAYTGLAGIYNTQKKFDLAADASAKASQYAGGAAGGGSAESSYNQGVILWNAGKYVEAKALFEAAVKADPNMGVAHYQLGMANLNLGQLPAARESFSAYLTIDPNGAKAAEVQGILKQLPQ